MHRHLVSSRVAAFSLSLAALALVACGDSGREATATTQPTTATTQPTGVTTAPATDASSTGDGTPTTTGVVTGGEATTTTGVSATSGTSEAADTSGGAKFDLAVSDLGDTTGTPASGCTKVDFLFVIDNSTSMEDNQTALIASFPGFIAAIKTALGDVTDYHVMVVDTDATGRCVQPCGVGDPDYEMFCAANNGHACKTTLDTCDNERGAGVLHPVGSFASNKKCKVFGGHRYMVPEEPDLLGAFACVAQVGTAGSSAERPMNAIEEAIGPELNLPDGCNAGFLRDDAILVITFLSDDGNHPDKGTPESWKASVVAAKNGDENAVVVAGLVPQPDLDCINPMTDGTQGSHWRAFIKLWGKHGISGSICEKDYAPFFAEAVAAIDQTCDEFNPPG